MYVLRPLLRLADFSDDLSLDKLAIRVAHILIRVAKPTLSWAQLQS